MTISIKTAALSAAMALALVSAAGFAEAAEKHKGGHRSAKPHHEKTKHGHDLGGHGRGGHMFDFGSPGRAGDVARTIDIVMKDNLYEPESIAIEAGETVRFRIRNVGKALHEFGLGSEEMHVAHRPQMAMMFEHGMLEIDRINRDRMKMDHGGAMGGMSHDDPNSVLVEPGESAEMIWTFTKAMALEFACNIPGHYESGMVGGIEFE